MTILQFVEENQIKKIQLAKQIGIDPSRLSLFLHRWKPLPKRYLPKLAEALGLSIAELEADSVMNR